MFEKRYALAIPIWLHPVFDERKPDNNIVFSWEYELTQSHVTISPKRYSYQVSSIKDHCAPCWGMVPYFAERIEHILPAEQAKDFKKFYVDTALLGNHKAFRIGSGILWK